MNAIEQALNDSARMLEHARAAVVATKAPSTIVAGTGWQGVGNSPLLKAGEQYRHFTGWSYVAIRAVAQRIATLPVYVARIGQTRIRGRKVVQSLPRHLKALGERLEPLDGHPLLDALDDPNELMLRWSLMVSTVASLELTGRSFWWLPDVGDRVEIWPLPTNWVRSLDAMRTLWEVRLPGGDVFTVPGDEMTLFALPSPADPFDTTSPLQTQAPAVATDEALQMAQHKAFANGNFPGLLIRAGRLPGMAGQPGQLPILTPEQRAELVTSIRTLYRGAANYNEPLILDGLIEGVERLTTTPAEMDFVASGGVTKSRIMQAFGVNPLIVGEIEGANRAQATIAEESFAANTINPLCELMSQAMTAWVAPRFARDGERLAVWIEPAVAHDPELSLRQWEVALRSGAATMNEFRTQVMNLEALPGMDSPPSLFSAPSAPAKAINGDKRWAHSISG